MTCVQAALEGSVQFELVLVPEVLWMNQLYIQDVFVVVALTCTLYYDALVYIICTPTYIMLWCKSPHRPN